MSFAYHRLSPTLLVVGLFLAATVPASAQSTNYVELNRLARQFQRDAFAQKMEAQMRARRLGLPLRVENASGQIFELMRFEDNNPTYYITDNLVAAHTIGTSKLWPGGSSGLNLTGAGITLREWDGGSARATHQEFGGRLTVMDGGSLSSHATHVAGTMIAGGVNASARGGSFQARLNSWDWDNDTGEMATEAANGMQISNHSYGTVTGWASGDYGAGSGWYWFGNPAHSQTKDSNFGFYNSYARSVDQITNNAPYYLPFKSAGNDRNQGPANQPTGFYRSGGNWVPNTVVRGRDGAPDGYDSLGPAATTKNMMVVAAVNDVPGGWTSPSSVTMSSFSSFGPTDDGRIKPDISANGVGLLSSTESSNSSYGSSSGTSMATPSASGSAGLLARQYEVLHSQKMRASTLRGLIIHTADEAGPALGPDYMFGWGLMNTARAADVIDKSVLDGGLIREATLNNSQQLQFSYPSDGSQPLKITICWNDPAAAVTGGMNDNPALKLVNDLDVRVSNGSTTYMPWVLNPAAPSAAATTGDNFRDNVEVIEIPATEAGIYTVTIGHKGSLSGGSQVVSMIVTGSVNNLPSVSSLTLTPATVKGITSSQGTVTLSAPAPAGGAIVALSSSISDATVPATITVPASQTSASFTVQTTRVPATRQASITGSYNATSASGQLTIQPPFVQSLTVAPNPQSSGGTSVGTVVLDSIAPTGGMIVNLSSSNTGAASVPATVVVPQGSSTANFNVTCGLVLIDSSTTITAAIEGTSQSVLLQVISSLVTYEPSSMVPTGAIMTSGSLNSLKTSDDDYLVWQPRNASMQFIAMDVLGFGEHNLKQLNFVVEISGNALVDYKVEAFNYSKRTWVLLGTIPASTSDATLTFPIASPSSFVNVSTRYLRARVVASPRSGAPRNWTSSIDRAIWTAQR